MSEKYDQLLNPSVRAVSLQAMSNVPDPIEHKLRPQPFDTICSLQNDPAKVRNAKRSLRKIKIATVLVLLFMIGEFVAGWLSNSVAVWSDALHMLSDLTGFLINYFGLKLSLRPPSDMWTFGYERVEIVAAIISIFLILVLTVGLCWEASQRIVHPQEVDGWIMIIVSCVGITTNIALGCVLSQSGHGHSHFGISGGCSGHSHGHKKKRKRSEANTEMGYRKLQNSNPSEELSVETQDHKHDHHSYRVEENKDNLGISSLDVDSTIEIKAGGHGHSHGHGHAHNRSAAKSMAVQASYLHALGDLLQNVGVLIAGIMITLKPEMFKVMDPICTFCFAILVFVITVPLLRKAFYVLMETSPRNINAKEMAATIADFDYVQAVRDFHIWNVGYTQTVLTAKLDVIAVENMVEENKHRCHCAVQYNVREKVLELAADNGIHHCDLDILVVSCKHSGERERKVVG